MTTRVIVKPAEGRLVRIPGTFEQIPLEGKLVELNSYWVRRKAVGDVTFEQAGAPAETKGEKK